MKRNRAIVCLAIAIILFQVGIAMAQSSWDWYLEKEKYDHYFYSVLDIGKNQHSQKLDRKIEMREDWREMFLPPFGEMSLWYIKPPWTLGFELGYNRLLAGNNQSWQIRLPISYQIFNLSFSDATGFYFAKEEVAGITLNWWDWVMVNDLVIEHFTPRVGIEIKKGSFGIGFSAQHYRLRQRDYRGKDRYGARNTSNVISSRQIEDGVVFRADFYFVQRDFYNFNFTDSMGLYMESMSGSKAVSFGLTASYKIF